MAAHLHDSVLQTLALIQKQAHDPRAVVRLARAQERDLRQWLYGDQDDADTTLRSALRKAAAEVEDRHGVPVELVVVGDAPLDPALTAVLRAAGEAMVNAAKHSGASRATVVARIEDGAVLSLTVADDGRGGAVELADGGATTGQGLRGMRQRAAGVDGSVAVTSPHGRGTTVTLTCPTRIIAAPAVPTAPTPEEDPRR